MKLSDAGLALIKRHEGLRLKAYPDPGTGGDPWTIGYGHTQGVQPGQEITQEQADDYLREDVYWSEDAVRDHVKVALAQNEFDALVSLVFNIGAGAFARSTLLRKLNAGDKAGAAAEFARWNQAGGKVLPGLVRRRADEAAMFSSGSFNTSAPNANEPPDSLTSKPEKPMAPFLIPAIVELAKAIPKLGGLFATSEVAQRNVKAAEVVMSAVVPAVQAANAQEAAEKIAGDPAARAVAEKAVQEVWWQISEAGGGGIDGASKRDLAYSQPDGPRFWHSPVFWVTMLLLPLIYLALWAVLFREGFSNDIKAMVLGAIFGGLLTGGIQAYFYGTSNSSQRKTELLSK